jgi:hypothetical protein
VPSTYAEKLPNTTLRSPPARSIFVSSKIGHRFVFEQLAARSPSADLQHHYLVGLNSSNRTGSLTACNPAIRLPVFMFGNRPA